VTNPDKCHWRHSDTCGCRTLGPVSGEATAEALAQLCALRARCEAAEVTAFAHTRPPDAKTDATTGAPRIERDPTS
jgi:hypothetical protein